MTSFELDDIYQYLSPTEAQNKGLTTARNIEEVFRRVMLDPRGAYHTWEEIKKNVNEYFNVKASADEKDAISKTLHVISDVGHLDLKDKDYWCDANRGAETVDNIYDCVKRTLVKASDSKLKKLSVFVSRDPDRTPGTRGVNDIDKFLNYTPPIVAASMQPYLDVEIEVIDPPQSKESKFLSYMTTSPSTMRFLLGAVDSTLSPVDSAIINADIDSQQDPESKDDKTIRRHFSGMETFLSPQTLTNMDGLAGDGVARIAPVKPFLPLASLEDLNINIVNNGANGDHKTAAMRLRVHDKARLAEFRNFIRPGGQASLRVWTTYGWLTAPYHEIGKNSYSDLINSRMLMRECWSPYDVQFAFDQSGQVVFTMQMITFGNRKVKETNIAMLPGFDNSQSQTKQLLEVMKAIGEFLNLTKSDQKFSLPATYEKILNEAASKGHFHDLKDVGNVENIIRNIRTSLKSGGIDPQKIDDLAENLRKIKDSKGVGLYDKLKGTTAIDIETRLSDLNKSKDPFLYTSDSATKKEKFFPKKCDFPNLIEGYKKRLAGDQNHDKEVRDSITGKNADPVLKQKIQKLNLKKAPDVVSFGTLFLNFVIPALSSQNEADDIQVYFYPLGSQCGPASGVSIAEFPISMEKFAYDYYESLRALGSETLTIPQFMKVLQNQLEDIRSIGYGMSDMYSLSLPGKREAEKKQSTKDKKYDFGTAEAEWAGKYGAWKPPIMEMTIETGDTSVNPEGFDIIRQLKSRRPAKSDKRPGDVKTVTRIHIYDKACAPYDLLQQVVDTGDGNLTLGVINQGKLGDMKSELSTYYSNKVFQALDEIAGVVPKGAGTKTSDTSKFEAAIDGPYGMTVKIPRDVQSFKQQLMHYFPKIVIGTNGSLVTGIGVSTKTDSNMGAANIIKAWKGMTSNAGPLMSPLEEPGHIPVVVNPIQITMTSWGVPIAHLQQTFFVDFGTGTTLDNLYKVSKVTHNIAQGKFVTSWTLIPSENSYFKFASPTSLQATVEKLAQQLNDQTYAEALGATKKAKKSKPATGKGQSGPGGKLPAKPAVPVTPAAVAPDAEAEKAEKAKAEAEKAKAKAKADAEEDRVRLRAAAQGVELGRDKNDKLIPIASSSEGPMSWVPPAKKGPDAAAAPDAGK